MQSFVDDMRDPKSESMAAVHFKNKYIPDNQCYVCHTSYGMFGTVEAKMSGMIDVYRVLHQNLSEDNLNARVVSESRLPQVPCGVREMAQAR